MCKSHLNCVRNHLFPSRESWAAYQSGWASGPCYLSAFWLQRRGEQPPPAPADMTSPPWWTVIWTMDYNKACSLTPLLSSENCITSTGNEMKTLAQHFLDSTLYHQMKPQSSGKWNKMAFQIPNSWLFAWVRLLPPISHQHSSVFCVELLLCL